MNEFSLDYAKFTAALKSANENEFPIVLSPFQAGCVLGDIKEMTRLNRENRKLQNQHTEDTLLIKRLRDQIDLLKLDWNFQQAKQDKE